MHSWTVTSPDRLDLFLAKDGRTLSRSKAQDIIQKNLVTVNGAVAMKSSQRLQEGDVVTMQEPKADIDLSHIEPADLRLNVLYEDDSCLVIDKPAGISVHPGAGMAPDEKTILNGIAFLFEKEGIPFAADSVLVHRLDKETTGCLLVAKNPEAHLFLQKQFELRTVKKYYLAIVAGVPDPPSAVIDAGIGRSSSDRTKMTIYGSGKSRTARTTYQTLQASDDAALLLCELHTGRTHQIRVHLLSLGHPILGDTTYTSPLSIRASEVHDIDTLCLHAWKLQVLPPKAKKEINVTSPLSPGFAASLKKTGMKEDLPSLS